MTIFARLFCLALGVTGFLRAGATGNNAAVLELMERAADWQLANPKPKEAPDTWVNAAFYAGVMALARDSASPRFHDAMIKMGEANQWKPASRIYHADDSAVTQTYLDLYLQHKDPR